MRLVRMLNAYNAAEKATDDKADPDAEMAAFWDNERAICDEINRLHAASCVPDSPILVELVLPAWTEAAARLLTTHMATTVSDRQKIARDSHAAHGPFPKMSTERIAAARQARTVEGADLARVMEIVNALPGEPIETVIAMKSQLKKYSIRLAPVVRAMAITIAPAPPAPHATADDAWTAGARAASTPEPATAAPPLPPRPAVAPVAPSPPPRHVAPAPPLPRFPPLPVAQEAPDLPRLPPPGADGKIAATFAQINAWARGRLHMAYDGSNIDVVNKAAATMFHMPEIVQVEEPQ